MSLAAEPELTLAVRFYPAACSCSMCSKMSASVCCCQSGELVPVGDVGGLGVGNVLVDLSYPAGGDETTLQLAGQFRGGAAADLDELADLLIYRRCGRRSQPGVSLAAFIALALRGYRADWCIGCRLGPAEAHAWIEIASGPVGEPDRPGRPLHITVRI